MFEGGKEMYKIWKVLSIIIILGAIVTGVLVSIAHEVDPWWVILCWLFVVTISRLELLFIVK